MKKLLISLFLVTVFLPAFSQITFTKRIGQLFEPTSMVETSDSCLLVAGRFTKDGNYSCLSKLTNNGDSIWFIIYDTLSTGGNPSPKIQIDQQGNIFMLTRIPNTHSVLRKLDSEGNVIWTRELSFYVSAFLSMNDVILVAGVVDYKPYLIKLNTDGDSITSRSFAKLPDRIFHTASTICSSGEDNYLLLYTGDFALTWGDTGFSYGITIDSECDSTGSFIIGDNGCHLITDVINTNENFLFAGFTDGETSQQYTSYFMNTDMQFNINWSQKKELEYASFIASIALPEDQEWFYAAGVSYQDNILLMKINVADGTTGWVRQFQEGLTSHGNDLICTKDGGIVICGYLEDLRGAPYYGILIKVDEYGNFNGIGQKNNTSGVSIIPNPAHQNVCLKWKSSGGEDKICITDAKGVILKTVKINAKPREEVSKMIDISEMSKGFYFCRIITGERAITTKMIIN